MKYFVWFLVFILLVAHQDNWFWEDDFLVAGFLPVGLFYHACLSAAASLTWLFAATFAWPEHLEQAAHRDEEAGS